MTLTLIHTAQVHVDTFDTLCARFAPDRELIHIVRPNWLREAQGGMTQGLRAEINTAVSRAMGPVLCTCTTLGEIAAEAGALRIDAPMMEAAAAHVAAHGGDILMAYCLESTLQPSVALLDAALEAQKTEAKVHTLSLAQFWPLFEADQAEAFSAVLASAIRENAPRVPDLSVIILAQASMADAAALLADMDMPVLSSPEAALRALLSKA